MMVQSKQLLATFHTAEHVRMATHSFTTKTLPYTYRGLVFCNNCLLWTGPYDESTLVPAKGGKLLA